MRVLGRVVRAVADVVLWAFAALGAVSIVLVVLALAFNLTLVMFKTGSMGPAIPAGSVALVQRIPASEIAVGDVVTVDIEGSLPITHRVTSVEPGPAPDQRVITMRGDANETDDPAPYTVRDARLVLGSVPDLARVIVWLSHPAVLAIIALGASAVVTVSFWPERTTRPTTGRGPDRRGHHDPRHADPDHGRHAASVGAASLLLAGAMALGGAPAPAGAAGAGETVVAGQYLTLTSITDPAMSAIEPGQSVHWQVGVAVNAPEPGEVHLGLSGDGSERLQLSATVSACSQRWVNETCAGEAWALPDLDQLPLDGVERPLLTMPSDEERWLLFTVTMSSEATPEPGDHVTQVIHASGHGETVDSGPGGLAYTGQPDLGPSLLLAGAAIALGFLIAALAHLRRRRAARYLDEVP